MERDNLKASGLMMLSMAAFTFNDTVMKTIGDGLPFAQLLFLRGVFATVLIAGLAWATGAMRARLSRREVRLIALRGLTEIGAAYFFITALFNMPLANVTAILQSLPLTVTLAAALMFREPVGWRRFSAIAAGFIGVMLIVRPGPDGFNPYAVYALIAVVCVTARDLVTRKLDRSTPSMLVTLGTSSIITVSFGSAALVADWQPVAPGQWIAILAASVFIFGGYLFSVLVMRIGEISFVAPFRYTGMIWALLLGLVVFGDWPDALTMLGLGIVVASGVFMLWRERKLARRLSGRAVTR